MLPPTPAARKLHALISALLDSPAPGEAAAAKVKLERLCAKYDFSLPDPEGADLFAQHIQRQRGDARPLADFPQDGTEAGSFIKWALEHAFGIEGHWRGTMLCVDAHRSSLAALGKITDTLKESFDTLWRQFAAIPGATRHDCRNFIRGLYDGMMRDEKRVGELLPQAAALKPVRVRGKKGAVALTGLAIHPYHVALDLGRKIRCQLPIAEVTHALETQIQIAA